MDVYLDLSDNYLGNEDYEDYVEKIEEYKNLNVILISRQIIINQKFGLEI